MDLTIRRSTLSNDKTYMISEQLAFREYLFTSVFEYFSDFIYLFLSEHTGTWFFSCFADAVVAYIVGCCLFLLVLLLLLFVGLFDMFRWPTNTFFGQKESNMDKYGHKQIPNDCVLLWCLSACGILKSIWFLAIAVLGMCECVFIMPLFYSHFPRILTILAFVFSDSGFSIYSFNYFFLPSCSTLICHRTFVFLLVFFLLVGFVHPFLFFTFHIFASYSLHCCCHFFFIGSEFDIPRLS